MARCVWGCVAMALLLGWGSGSAVAQEASGEFRRWDANSDGQLARDELPEFFRPLFERIDADSNGTISPEEDRRFRGRVISAGGTASAEGRPPMNPMPRLPDSVRVEFDIPYAGTDNPKQKLDLYFSKNAKSDKPLPVVAFIHGGAWQQGDRRGGFRMIEPMVASGDYVGCSIGYRLSGEAIWPAQIEDCKAAVRWLRAHGKEHGIDPERIGVMGSSAGGHLVGMLGTTGGVTELEGSLGADTSTSSRVQAVVDLFGPADFGAFMLEAPQGPVARLLGATPQSKPELAKAASPISYVSKDDPPFLIIHGSKDPVVPYSQSVAFEEALEKAGVDTMLVKVVDGGHGNFNTPAVPERIKAFFDKHLLGRDVKVGTEAIIAK